MTSGQKQYLVEYLDEFYETLKEISDKKIQDKLLKLARNLSIEPEKKGDPLRGVLKGLNSFHFSRYRIIYRISPETSTVAVMLVGRRKSGSKADIYAILRRLKRL